MLKTFIAPLFDLNHTDVQDIEEMFLSLNTLTITYTHNNQIIQIHWTSPNHKSDKELLQIQDEVEFPKERHCGCFQPPNKTWNKNKTVMQTNETKPPNFWRNYKLWYWACTTLIDFSFLSSFISSVKWCSVLQVLLILYTSFFLNKCIMNNFLPLSLYVYFHLYCLNFFF